MRPKQNEIVRQTNKAVKAELELLQDLLERAAERGDIEIFLGMRGQTCVQAKVRTVLFNGCMLQITARIFSPPDLAKRIKYPDHLD